MADYRSIARPYARAVLEVARAAGKLEAWSAALAAAAAVVDDEDARAYLSRPALAAADKAQFVESVCSGLTDAEVLRTEHGRNLLALLADNRRLEALPEIAAQFERLKHEVENTVSVTLVSAAEVDDEQVAKVRAALERRLGRTVELNVEIDESLLGGGVLRAEDMVIDGSVKSRLARLADSLIE